MILKNNKKFSSIYFRGKKIKSILKNDKLIYGKKLQHRSPYYMIIDQSNGVTINKSDAIDEFFNWFMGNIKPCLAKMQENGIMACVELAHDLDTPYQYNINRYNVYFDGTEPSANFYTCVHNIRGTEFMVYLPKVYYLGIKLEQDKFIIYFDKKPFIGAVSNLGCLIGWTCCSDMNSKLYAHGDVWQGKYDDAVSKIQARGEGYDLVSFDIRCLLSFMYMISEGIEFMDKGNTSLFGIDSWVKDRAEFWKGAKTENKQIIVEHDDGNTETFDCSFFPSNVAAWNITKMHIGKYLMLIPTEIGAQCNWGDQIGRNSPWNAGIGLYNNGPNYAAYPENGATSVFSGAFDKGGIGAAAACKLLYRGPLEWWTTPEQIEYFDKEMKVIN